MRFDIDTYREIVDTITRNKARSFLTGFGVFWGVFMLVGLMGGGKGLKELLDKNFEGFAQNTVIIGAEQTTKPYKGFRKGRWWSMEYKDINRLKQRVPELDAVVPMIFSRWRGNNTAYYGDQKTQPRIQGTVPEMVKVITPKMYYGRYLNEMDMREQRKVCVIGKKIYKELFKHLIPKGKYACCGNGQLINAHAQESFRQGKVSSQLSADTHPDPCFVSILRRHLNEPQYGRMMRIEEGVQFGLLPVNGQGVLCQVVGSQAEKVHFLCQSVTDQSRRRGFDHDACLDFLRAGNSLFF